MPIDIRVAGEPPWGMTQREHSLRAKAAELVTVSATRAREESNERAGCGSRTDPTCRS